MHRFVPIPALFISLIPSHTFASLLHFGTFQRGYTLVPNSCPVIQLWDFRRIWLYPRKGIDTLWTQFVFELQGSQVTPRELCSLIALEKKYVVRERITRDTYTVEMVHTPTGIVCAMNEIPTSPLTDPLPLPLPLPLANAFVAVKKAVSEFTPERLV